MPRVQSIQMRVLLWGWGVLIVGLALAFWRYSATLDEETAREFEADTLARLETAQWMLDRGGPFKDARERQDFLHSLAGHMGMRISLISGGQVLADSSVPLGDLAKLDDHSGRPEVAAATSGEVGQATRHSTTLDRDMIYMAKKLPAQAGEAEAVAAPGRAGEPGAHARAAHALGAACRGGAPAFGLGRAALPALAHHHLGHRPVHRGRPGHRRGRLPPQDPVLPRGRVPSPWPRPSTAWPRRSRRT